MDLDLKGKTTHYNADIQPKKNSYSDLSSDSWQLGHPPPVVNLCHPVAP